MELTSPITTLPKVGPATQEKLVRLGITTVADLLLHTPTSYSDYTHVLKVVDLKPGIEATIVGRVLSFHSRRSFRRRLTIQEAVIEDDTGAIRAIWFNQPFLEKTLEKGTEFRFSGKVEYKQNKLQFQNPAFEYANTEATHTGRLVPVYPLTEGLTHKLLRFWIRTALERVREIPDDLPDYIRRNEQLLNKKDALFKIHFPQNTEESERARKRLGFDELFTLQLHAESVRRKFHQRKAHSIAFEPRVVRAFTESLPFSLTADQKKASYEILQDLTRSHPANRLLEGDVGSGKTVCALACVHEVLHAGFQASLLAPTEILAAQHFETACRLLEPFGYHIALLTSKSIRMHTGEAPPRSELLAMIRTGKIQFVVGTHAVLQPDVRFKNLAFSVVDEQQRFGVAQRGALQRVGKGKTPHLLSMTATPIPRSLALTLYGELDLSIIKSMPKGRKKILTYVVPPQKRKAAYGFIKKELETKRQVFVIFPLIDESELVSAKAATVEQKRLQQKVFPTFQVGLMHGRMKKEEKQNIMQQFRQGKIDILVSTSVVEVGIDIPNATVMMIENAERFGLAQLHQFRGRVGRGSEQSYCLLFSESSAQNVLERLKSLETLHDGFALAEKDLELRGPGEVYGKTQSGFFQTLRLANVQDHELLTQAKRYAKDLIAEDPTLKKHPRLSERLERFEHKVHLE